MTQSRTSIVITDAGVWAGVVALRRRTWTVTASAFRPVQVPAALRTDTDLEEMAAAAIEASREIRALDAPARLAIPASWLLTHPVELSERRFNAQVAAYEFEAFLPVPLEEITCIFVERPRVGRASGIPRTCGGMGVATKPIRALLARLGAAGIDVHWLVPAMPGNPLEPDGRTPAGRLWCDQHSVAIMLPIGGTDVGLRLGAFRVGGDRAQSILNHIRILADEAGRSGSVWCLDGRIDDRTLADVAGCNDHTIERGFQWLADEPPIPLLLPSATDDQYNLRVGPLAHRGGFHRTVRHGTRCLSLASVLLIMTSVGSWRQSRQCGQMIGAIETEERDLYSVVFPGKPVPAGAALRLASERRRLEGLTQTSLAPISQRTDPVALFREVVAAIPERTRVNIQDLRIDNRELSIRGLTTSHRDAEQIAMALRKIDNLAPRPPRSDAIKEGGVSFSLRVEYKETTAQRQTDAFPQAVLQPAEPPLLLVGSAEPEGIWR